ncbi:MAG: chorismate-binding protein [Candidatus Thalassarchaeaceae archaeon]
MRIIERVEHTSHESPLIAMIDSGNHNSDELLLHSGGPVSDLSKFSMLPALDSLRFLFFEPQGENLPEGSALNGEISLGSPSPLNLILQRFIDGRWQTEEEFNPETLEQALSIVAEHEITTENNSNHTITPGGFAGLLGYDLGRWSNSIRIKNSPQPGTLLGVLWRCDAWWIHNRQKGELILLALEGHDWINDAMPELIDLKIPSIPDSRVPESESDSDHARKVERIRQAIKGGHLYQVNYGRKWQGEIEGKPWEVFLRMTRSNPAPFASWLNLADYGWAIASASPERLMRLESGIVSTRPIKGTRPRGKSDSDDSNLRLELASSEKEMAEHLMLVDLERHDLASVCKKGSVNWSECRIEALANVQHLVSGVEGELSPNTSVGKSLASLFPGGSITGCPKVVTMAAIDELEGSPRSAWTGSIGHINQSSGQSDWNILIRTMEARSGPDSWFATVQAGGGVVIDSNPAAEVEEARWKAAAVAEATWGFRTGFSMDELPEREVGILPLPTVEGALGAISPEHSERVDLGSESHVLLVDNLDSFTNNIADSLHRLGSKVTIVEGRGAADFDIKNQVDMLLEKYSPTHIILGPGPSRPEVSSLSMEIASRALENQLAISDTPIPLLGWCLGHQAIGIAAGWDLVESPIGAVHGVPSKIKHDGSGLYTGLSNDLVMMRYNSLVLKETNGQLRVNSWDESDSLIMGISHPNLPIEGVQFHPESVGSPDGLELLKQFLNMGTECNKYSLSKQARQP